MPFEQVKEIVISEYDSLAWKDKVNKMPTRQIYAIYYSLMKRKEKKQKCEQLKLF